ncbi:MAG TPA: nitroreductase family deazaflavin-dependent oxidoreductase [Candidatus Limnocylindrales bacterium]|nr:nitroreductase family deazaflavin-dependent oxidoreductase [Candidatus Limnocylindrales bacterium]
MLADRVLNLLVRPFYRVFRGGMVRERILILHTRGRRTGAWHPIPLNYVSDRPGYAVIASNWGRPVMPAWYGNLRADPNVRVEIGGRRLDALAEVVGQTDHDRLWPTFVQIYPPYLSYRKKTNRDFPIVRLIPR